MLQDFSYGAMGCFRNVENFHGGFTIEYDSIKSCTIELLPSIDYAYGHLMLTSYDCGFQASVSNNNIGNGKHYQYCRI